MQIKEKRRKNEKNVQQKLEDRTDQLRLVSEEDVKIRAKKVREDLRKFAETVINERIRICKENHKDEPLDKCACEAIRRYINLYKKSPTRAMTKDKLSAIEKLFEEMKREGKIKCPE